MRAGSRHGTADRVAAWETSTRPVRCAAGTRRYFGAEGLCSATYRDPLVPNGNRGATVALAYKGLLAVARPPRQRGTSSARVPEIDALRVVAMVSVFAAHAAQPFNPWDAWLVQRPERSKWLGELVLFFAPWVMPLFVLLAGASAWHSLGKRSARAYLDERVVRLIIPLAAGILILVPPQVYLDRRQRGLFDGSLLAFYPHFFEGIYPEGNFAWAHLWFLGILALIAAITLPLCQWLRGMTGARVMSWAAGVCTPRGAILLLAVPLLAVRVALWAVFPHARPITTDWTNRTTLLAVFVNGYVVAGEPRLLHAVDRQWTIALGVAVTFSAGMFVWAWPADFTERFPIPFTTRYALVWSAYTVGGWAWSVAWLGGARRLRCLARRSLDRVLVLLNPFYMLHQTIIVVLAFYLRPVAAGPIATYAAVFAVALAATVALSAASTRSHVARLLLGVRGASRHRSIPFRGYRHGHV